MASLFEPKSSVDNPLFLKKDLKLVPENMLKAGRQELEGKQQGQDPVRRARLRLRKEDNFEMDARAKVWMEQTRKACGFGGDPSPGRMRAYECAFSLLKENKSDEDLIHLSKKFGKGKARNPLPESMKPKAKVPEFVLSEVAETKKKLRELVYSTMRIKGDVNEVSQETQKLFNNFNNDVEIDTIAQFILFTRGVIPASEEG